MSESMKLRLSLGEPKPVLTMASIVQWCQPKPCLEFAGPQALVSEILNAKMAICAI